MDYCILVTISRNCISFRYCRADGEGRFVDFPRDGECEMPFAIECAGNEFVIGQKALETATKGLSQNAFADIFDTCKGIKTFQFAGREEQLNKLPYFAIRYYISKILSDSFYGDKGTIDSNVSQLPLVFLFTPELDIDRRLFITNPFEKAGFQNLYSIGYHQLLLPVAMDSLAQERQKVKAAIMVSVDAGDLLLQTTFDVMTCKSIDESIRIDGKGYDPRLKQATDLIWSRLFGYKYKSREPEESILKAAALDFLNGDAPSVNGTLTMSDGSKQDYFLSRGDLDVSAIGDVRSLVDYKLSNFLQDHDLQKQQCMVVLVGNAATDYFEKIFRPMAWAAVAKVQDKMKRAMLDKLYKMVADANYEVRNLFGNTINHQSCCSVADREAEIPLRPVEAYPLSVGECKTSTTISHTIAYSPFGTTIEDSKLHGEMRAGGIDKSRVQDPNGIASLVAGLELWIKRNAELRERKEDVSRLDKTPKFVIDTPPSQRVPLTKTKPKSLGHRFVVIRSGRFILPPIKMGVGKHYLLHNHEGIKIDFEWDSEADLDVSAFLVDKFGITLNNEDFVFYNSNHRANPETGEVEPFNDAMYGNKECWRTATVPVSADGSVLGSADDTGSSSAAMHVRLSKVSSNIREIKFFVSIYNGDRDGITFRSVRKLVITIYDEDTGVELCSYDIKKKFSKETAVEAAKLVLNDKGEWEFVADSYGYEGGLGTLIDMFMT